MKKTEEKIYLKKFLLIFLLHCNVKLQKLNPNEGTKLYKNSSKIQNIEFIFKDVSSSSRFNAILISGNEISWIKTDTNERNFSTEIQFEQQYMVINLSLDILELKFSTNPENHECLYDPYLYENAVHENVDSAKFVKNHNVQGNYLDILSKWYSIKFSYSKENLIFIRPGLGISFQTHKMREEKWEVLQGNPIIIAHHHIFYNTNPGDKFIIPIGALHSMINPSNQWICIKETYSGVFDEEDITRIFNPNKYK